jgi:flagellar basal body-associated protein FliL
MFRLRPFLWFCALAACLSGLGEAPAWAAENPAQPAQRKTTQSESYVMIEPIYASILDGTRPRGLLLVEFGLDVPDAGLRERVNQALPALRDAYVRGLLTYAATAVRPWRQPNVEDLANRIQAITDRSLGKKGAKVLMAQTAIRLTR